MGTLVSPKYDQYQTKSRPGGGGQPPQPLPGKKKSKKEVKKKRPKIDHAKKS